jgi:HlyD family secretion protein
MKSIDRRVALAVLATVAVGACQTGEAAEENAASLLTTTVSRGDLLIRAEAVGSVEPVREVEVKSKASGEILRLFIDIGDIVERGTLLAEIDPRDVRNRYDQTEADLAVAEAQLEISQNQLDRQRRLLEAEVITQAEFESATLSFANATAGRVRAQTNFDLAELQLADVNIRAPMSGTIIQKNVEEGTVIQSASSNVSGGTALFIMADLGDMQVRTLVDETDMGELQPGQVAAVKVEAFPDRTFRGTIDKIEPQAINEQNVTMFPVIVTIDNRSGLLKPGMNAEVEVFIDEALGVLMVANNAIVQVSDAGPAAMALGLDLEDIDMSQFMRAGRGGSRGRSGGAAQGGRQGGMESGGAEGQRGGDGARGARGAAGATGGISTEAAAQMQALRTQVEAGEITQDSMRAAMRALAGARAGGSGAAAPGEAPPRETRPAVLFVLGVDSIPEPRLVQLGLGDWDHTQIVSGVEEGETIVIVSAAQMQARQQEFMSRFTGGSSPFGGGGRR